jgi:hypothetical protein
MAGVGDCVNMNLLLLSGIFCSWSALGDAAWLTLMYDISADVMHVHQSMAADVL